MADATQARAAAERIAGTARDSYETVVDHAAAMGERNARFAQGFARDLAAELRHQAESNRSVALEVLDRAERQREALRTIASVSIDAYLDLLYWPVSVYRDGLEVAGRNGTR